MKMNITIDFKPGSEHQEEFAKTAIRSMLLAFLHFMERSHKQNEIRVSIDTEELKSGELDERI